MSIAITLLALAVEATFGYPPAVLRAIGHPVIWLGWLIGWLDNMLNTGSGVRRRATGILAAVLIVAVPAVLAHAVESAMLLVPFGFVALALLASSLIAQRSLHEHVARVAEALERNGLCLLYTSPSPRDRQKSRMPSSA